MPATHQQRSLVRRSVAPALLAVVAVAGAGSAQALSTNWTTDADFAAGTTVDVDIATDAISLTTDGVGIPDSNVGWWNAAWGQRRCLDVTNNEATPLSEFQVTIEVDTAAPIAGGRMSPTGDDIRFISSDGTTQLDYWIEGPLDDAASTIWIQTDTLAPGANTVCMYYDNAAATPRSDVYAPFTYTAPEDLYVAVSETQAGMAIAVTSYVADNTISDGTTSVTLGVGGTHTFPASAAHTASTVVSATGPIAVQGTGNNADSFVPLAFAGTEFVVATSRNINRLSLYAPFATATVSVQIGATVTNTVVPAGTSVSIAAEIPGATQSAIVTSDEPVLLTHQASGSYDAIVAIPASDAPLFGIRSSVHNTGFLNPTSVTITESDGTLILISGPAGGAVARGSGGSQGTGPAVISTVTSGGPINATQQADSDGVESTSHWPQSELNVVYRIPVDMQYVAFACPEQATANLQSDGTTLNCTGAGGPGFPGKARDAGGLVAGDVFESLDGVPFYVYGEDNLDDENNILGPKQARLATSNPPTTSIGPEESQYVSSGSWTSEARDTGCAAFFGELTWNPETQSGGTTVELRIATSPSPTGPFTFLGPDGTPGTAYTIASGTPIATVHDGDQYVQTRVDLASDPTRVATPTVSDVDIDWLGETTVSGNLFGDANGDAIRDLTETGLGGIDVALWRDDGDGLFDDASDTEVTVEVSDTSGDYSFSRQPADTYFVIADEGQLPTGYATPATTPNPAGPVIAPECGETTADIGWQPTGSVDVSVFSDVDGDGTADAGDLGIGDTPVQLWLDDGDGLFDAATDTRVSTNTTDATGRIELDGLPPGDYFVRVPDTPSGHLAPATTPNPSGLVTVSAGSATTIETGFQPIAGLSGTAFADVNGDGEQQPDEPGLADLFVIIYLDDGDGVFDPSTDQAVTTVSTDADGDYVAADIAPGDYWLVPFTPPPPSLPAAPLAVTVATGPSIADIPFAQTEAISGVVIFDADGILDDSSIPMPGVAVSVHLDDGDGIFEPDSDMQVSITATNADGEFVFAGLAPGAYFVRVGPSTLLTLTGIQIVGDNPIGPVAPSTTGLVFAFDPTSIELPATGATAAHGALRLGGASFAAGLLLLAGTRRRRTLPSG